MTRRRTPVQSPPPAFAPAARTPRSRIQPLEPNPPAWVLDVLAGGGRDSTSGAAPQRLGLVDVTPRGDLARVTTRIPSAVLLSADELSLVVAERYAQIGEVLFSLGKQAIRIWNYIPDIVHPLAPGVDRYMAFNRGRHAAYLGSAGNSQRIAGTLPSASAVGIGGQDLVIDLLASSAGGTPVENPRQVASWRYSRRYGPKPPCFARGTRTTIDGRPVLLLAGTASIVGEESQHPDNARAQLLETLRNIESLILTAGAASAEPLQLLEDVRVYVVNAADAPLIERELQALCAAARVEAVLARLCRPELLVEIEGVVRLS